jgi:hypothetical protein
MGTDRQPTTVAGPSAPNYTPTPGPWAVHQEGRTLTIRALDPAIHQSFTLATVNGSPAFGEHRGKMEANARLIAAAPQMLATLRGLMAWINAHDADEGDEVTLADRRYSGEGTISVNDARTLLAQIDEGAR